MTWNRPRLFSLTEAAEYVGIPRPTFRSYVEDGLLHSEMVGRTRIFFQRDLDDFKQTWKKRGRGRPRVK